MVQRMSLQICKSFFVGRRLRLPHQAYLNFQFSKPRFRLRKALIYKNIKGHGSLALLEWQCFWNHFQGTAFKMDLIDSIIWPTILYGFEVWGIACLSLIGTRWRVYISWCSIISSRLSGQFLVPLFKQSFGFAILNKGHESQYYWLLISCNYMG